MTLLAFFLLLHTAPTEFYTLSLHDALPISDVVRVRQCGCPVAARSVACAVFLFPHLPLYVLYCSHLLENPRSEEHTSELQSQSNLVCRLLLEKKKDTQEASLTPSTRSHTVS